MGIKVYVLLTDESRTMLFLSISFLSQLLEPVVRASEPLVLLQARIQQLNGLLSCVALDQCPRQATRVALVRASM